MGAAESPWAAVTGWPVAGGQPPRRRSATNVTGPGGLLGWGLGARFWGVWKGHLFLGRVTSGSQNRGKGFRGQEGPAGGRRERRGRAWGRWREGQVWRKSLNYEGRFCILKFLKKISQKSNFLEGFMVNFESFGTSVSSSLRPSHLSTLCRCFTSYAQSHGNLVSMSGPVWC